MNTIVDMIWGTAPPQHVRNQVQVHASNIRKALRLVGADDLLETRTAGYLLRLQPGASDVGVFTALESTGAAAFEERRFRAAAEAYRLAQKAWRGPALDGLDAAFVEAEARLLEERRRSVFRRWVDIEIGLNRPHHLVPALFAANRRDPFDEGVCLRLMAALQRSGRSAQALDVYRDTKRLLDRELAIAPDESLRAAQRALLCSEPIEHDAWNFLELEPV